MTDILNIQNKSDIEVDLTILDGSGNNVFNLILGGNETRIIEVSDWMSGIYYINDKFGKLTKFVVVK